MKHNLLYARTQLSIKYMRISFQWNGKMIWPWAKVQYTLLSFKPLATVDNWWFIGNVVCKENLSFCWGFMLTAKQHTTISSWKVAYPKDEPNPRQINITTNTLKLNIGNSAWLTDKGLRLEKRSPLTLLLALGHTPVWRS